MPRSRHRKPAKKPETSPTGRIIGKSRYLSMPYGLPVDPHGSFVQPALSDTFRDDVISRIGRSFRTPYELMAADFGTPDVQNVGVPNIDMKTVDYSAIERRILGTLCGPQSDAYAAALLGTLAHETLGNSFVGLKAAMERFEREARIASFGIESVVNRVFRRATMTRNLAPGEPHRDYSNFDFTNLFPDPEPEPVDLLTTTSTKALLR